MKKILKNKKALIGFIIVMFFFLIAIFAPLIAKHSPIKVDIGMKLKGPSKAYWLGTDNLGRCIASRIIYGARTSMGYSFIVLAITFIISIPIGVIAGYVGRTLDAIIMRIIDIILAIPQFMLALAIAGTLGASMKNMILAMSLVSWAGFARIIRGMAIQLKEQDFIMAARASGCSSIQIVIKHILKNMLPQIIILATLELGTIILSIASFSFIGLGAQPPTPEWGIMISDARNYIQTQPQLMIYPGIAIVMVVAGFNLLGEGLKDLFGRKR